MIYLFISVTDGIPQTLKSYINSKENIITLKSQ